MSFNEDVFEVVRLISKERVTSYGTLAKYIRDARTSRRAGWDLNKSFTVTPNVPAHSEVNRFGMLSGALHFPPKKFMAVELREEGVQIKEGQVVEFDKYFWDPMTEL